MHLYNFPLLPATGIARAVLGQFTGVAKQQEICVVRGEHDLELLRVDAETGRVVSLLRQHVFGVVRSVQAFRLTGAVKGIHDAASDAMGVSVA